MMSLNIMQGGRHLKKSERHAIISNLIQKNTIRTQDELRHLLKEHGVNATQATISRDIRDLRIVKTVDAAGLTYFQQFEEKPSEEAVENDHLNQMIQDVVTKVDRVQFMTILHTIPNNAPILAAAIDEVEMTEKVCSLAGFDIVVIISPNEEAAMHLETLFKQTH